MPPKLPILEKKRRACERAAAHARKFPNYGRNQKLKKNYGITIDQYDAWNEAFGKVCHLCDQKCPTGRRLAVDHDHKTGLIRGLLCINCNKGIGNFKDNQQLLLKAIQYLKDADETEAYVNNAIDSLKQQKGVPKECGDRDDL